VLHNKVSVNMVLSKKNQPHAGLSSWWIVLNWFPGKTLTHVHTLTQKALNCAISCTNSVNMCIYLQ